MAENGDRPSRMILDKLLEQRIVVLSEPVMPKSAQRLQAQFLYLNAKDKKAPIHFYLNSPGGSVSDGFAVYDTIRFIDAPVITLCTGLSASMGTILQLAPREKENRLTLPNTRFMIHQPSSMYQGPAADIEVGAKQILKLRDLLIDIYVRETNKTADEIRRDMNRDFWMNAQEAVEYGICARVVNHIGDI